MITRNFPHIAQTVLAHQTVEITGEVYIGENCELASHVTLMASNGRLIIGESTIINQKTRVYTRNKRTTIGNNVKIGSNCTISADIGDKSVIGDNVILNEGVKIGKNCKIIRDQQLENIHIPDNSTVTDGIITINK